MKPDAPAEYRGIWKPIRTARPRLRHHASCFPNRRQVTDKFSMVRSLHHDTGDHFAGGHRMLTAKDMGVSGANNDRQIPVASAPSSTARSAPRQRGMPGYVAVPHASSIGLTSRLLRRQLARRHAQPFPAGGDPNAAELHASTT